MNYYNLPLLPYYAYYFWKDMFFLGQIEYGVYENDFWDFDPQILSCFYGTDHQPNHKHLAQSGARHPPDESNNNIVLLFMSNPDIIDENHNQEWEDISTQIAENIQCNFHY